MSLPAAGQRFRKSRFACLPLVLASLIIGVSAYTDIAALHRSPQPPTTGGLILTACAVLAPLVFALRQWIYTIVVSDEDMQIRSFRTVTLRFDQISDLKMQAYRGFSYCVVKTTSGKTIDLPTDLADFLPFLRTLAQMVHEARAGARSQ